MRPIAGRHHGKEATGSLKCGRLAGEEPTLAEQVPPGGRRRRWRRRNGLKGLIQARRDDADAARIRGEHHSDGFGKQRDAVQVQVGELVGTRGGDGFFRGRSSRLRLRFEAGTLGGGAGHEGVVLLLEGWCRRGVFLLRGPVAAGEPGFRRGCGELGRGDVPGADYGGGRGEAVVEGVHVVGGEGVVDGGGDGGHPAADAEAIEVGFAVVFLEEKRGGLVYGVHGEAG